MRREVRRMSHVTLGELAALWCGDASDADALEDHVFACDACAAAYTRLAATYEALGSAVLPVVSHAQRDRLLARGRKRYGEKLTSLMSLRDAVRWKCRSVSVASHGKVLGVSTRSPMQK